MPYKDIEVRKRYLRDYHRRLYVIERRKKHRSSDEYRASAKIRQRNWELKCMGATQADVYSAMERQHGCCAICGVKPEADRFGRALRVDHDHSTGKFRGLLCHSCNVALGSFRDDVTLLRNAIRYLGVSNAQVQSN